MNNVKKSIGWADFTINPVKGLCPVDCKDNQGKEYCYARKMYRRFKWNPEIRFDVQSLLDIEKIKKPSRIFVGSTIELFGEWIDAFWLDSIFRTVKDNPRHTFIFLTRQPLNAIKFMGGNPEYHHYKKANKMPSNVWLGVSITNKDDAPRVRDLLLEKMATVNFLSIEPLLGHLDGWALDNVVRLADWVIIGQQTPLSKKTEPKLEWIQEIVEAVDKAKIPVFLKNNLHLNISGQDTWALDKDWGKGKLYRQEMPKV